MAAVTIKNIGPIESLSIPVPAKGGVVVLRGRQGDGKSTALRAVSILGGRSDKSLSVRDGQKNGAVEFGGVKLSVSRARQAKSGELEVDSIEGRFDIGRLVDPQIADEERADAARIKQLIALTGAKADAVAYYNLAGAKGLELDVEDDTDDPIELYKRMKKACDQAAVRAEREAAMLPDVVDGAPPEAGVSVPEAQKAQEKAAVEWATLKRAKAAADRHKESYAAALERMAQLEAADQGERSDVIAARVAQSEQQLIALTKELDSLQTRIAAERSTLREAKAAQQDAERHEASLAEARKAVESLADAASGPTDEEIQQAEQEAIAARKATEEAVRNLDSRQHHALLVEKVKRRKFLVETAETWRELGKQCEVILAQSLPESVLRVDGARLVTSTDRSASEPYGDLSHGERAIIAIEIVAKYLTAGGLATISQEIWSGISPENQKRINDEARKRGIVIVTADVQDSPLTVDVME